MDLTSWSAGEDATATKFNARIQANFTAIGVTTTYTPTIGGTGWAKGNGTCTGYYTDTGCLVQLAIKFILGTTSTGGTGGLTFSVPVGAVSSGKAIGLCKLEKGGAGYIAMADLTTSTITLICQTSAVGAMGSFVINGAPSAGNWANGDAIYVSIAYFR